jgi:hypothetical protein
MSCTDLQKLLDAAHLPACFSSSTVASEKGKSFRFDNPNKKTVCRVQIDGCLITDQATLVRCIRRHPAGALWRGRHLSNRQLRARLCHLWRRIYHLVPVMGVESGPFQAGPLRHHRRTALYPWRTDHVLCPAGTKLM